MELSANVKSDGSSPTHLPKCSSRSFTLFLQTAWISFNPYLNSSGLPSVGSALVKSSNCKVFCIVTCHIPIARMACRAFHMLVVANEILYASLFISCLTHLQGFILSNQPAQCVGILQSSITMTFITGIYCSLDIHIYIMVLMVQYWFHGH